jgi:hypothetical protein
MQNFDNEPIRPFTEQRSEVEQINYLKSRNTNFIFLFGKPGVGKTSITASLIHYLSAICEQGNVERVGNHDGKGLAERIRFLIASGRFPNRTKNGSLTEVDCCFVPYKKNLTELRFTFLEMSGEDLKMVDVHNYDGKLPDNIDVFFKVDGLSLIFILVTSHDETRNDDSLMANFLDYLIEKSPIYRHSRILLLISKWDEVPGNPDIEMFISANMPLTFRKINKANNAFCHFSLGKIEEKVDGQIYIRNYDSESPERIFEWLYKTLTGRKLFGLLDTLKKQF